MRDRDKKLCPPNISAEAGMSTPEAKLGVINSAESAHRFRNKRHEFRLETVPGRFQESSIVPIVEFTRLFFIQAARGGINVETERGAAHTVSVLTLAAVTQDDIGNYSCRPTEGRSATVTLIVQEGWYRPFAIGYTWLSENVNWLRK